MGILGGLYSKGRFGGEVWTPMQKLVQVEIFAGLLSGLQEKGVFGIDIVVTWYLLNRWIQILLTHYLHYIFKIATLKYVLYAWWKLILASS